MRSWASLGLVLLMLASGSVSADAAPRTGGHGTPRNKPAKRTPTEKPATPVADLAQITDPDAPLAQEPPKELTPALALANMIYFEFAQGIHDYAVEVIETETDLRTDLQTTLRKQIYFLGPATTLTLQDGQALNVLNAELFSRFLDGVDLDFDKGETINGIPCHVIRVTPREGAFKENSKFYYLAQDDFRKIRIRAIKSDAIQKKKYWFVNDFSYKEVTGGHLLLSNTLARLLTWELIPLTTTQAVFQKYSINRGLDANFFSPYLKDMKFNDTFKD